MTEKRKKKYANAKDVLPKELIAEIQKHYHGMLWIPSPNVFFEERAKLVIELKSKGVQTKAIAHLAGVSTRRVRQILAKR